MVEQPLHRSEDLHASGLVWLSRRKDIQAVMCREFPHLSSVDILSIVNGCCLYTTCRDDFWAQIYEERMLPDQEVA
jgi:hypothetical protein